MTGRVTASLDDLVALRAEARGFSLSSRQPVASLLAGRHASRLRGRGLTFEELRDYRPGDDIRAMDWRATARLRSPHVRVYSEERDRPVLLVVDQRRPMFFGSRRAMKSVAAAEFAALAAWRTLEGGDRVGGLVFGDDGTTVVRPHRSRNRVHQFLQEVAAFNAALAAPDAAGSSPAEAGRAEAGRGDGGEPGAASLNGVLRQVASLCGHDHLVVLISDFADADDDTERLAARLAARNDVLAVAVYDPLGISLEGAPGMRATDRERTWDVPAGAGFGRAFRATFERRLDRWRQSFRALRVPVLPISAARPIPEQVRELFGRRGAPR